jgi:hypothetical protein
MYVCVCQAGEEVGRERRGGVGKYEAANRRVTERTGGGGGQHGKRNPDSGIDAWRCGRVNVGCGRRGCEAREGDQPGGCRSQLIERERDASRPRTNVRRYFVRAKQSRRALNHASGGVGGLNPD